MAAVTSTQQDQILEKAVSSVRILSLNRPNRLNALSSEMVSRLLELFLRYEHDSNVKLVVLKGIGRSFCAGGDVLEVDGAVSKGGWTLGAKFFNKEFVLNYLMATYSKPQVSILNGIVMGGGCGVSMHGRFRVATENSVFAMPETALSLFPDVGASYFLSRLPGFFGEYLALTGARLDGAELHSCGLATHFVPSSRLSSMEELLCKADSSDHAIISAVIDKFSEQPYMKDHSSIHRMDIIDKCFSRKTVEEILSALERENIERPDSWISATIQLLKKASPISLKITLRSIREGRLQGVGQCLVREYRMVCHVLRGEVSKDFFEGCRAILKDKDKNPKWEPSKLELISEDMIDQYFSKLSNEWEDLQLPKRKNLPAFVTAKL